MSTGIVRRKKVFTIETANPLIRKLNASSRVGKVKGRAALPQS